MMFHVQDFGNTIVHSSQRDPKPTVQWTRVSRGNHPGTWKWGIRFSSLCCASLLRRYDIKLLSCFISLGSWRSYEKQPWDTHVENSDKGNYAILWREVRNQMYPVPYHPINHYWSLSSHMCTTPHLSPDPFTLGPSVLKAVWQYQTVEDSGRRIVRRGAGQGMSRQRQKDRRSSGNTQRLALSSFCSQGDLARKQNCSQQTCMSPTHTF